MNKIKLLVLLKRLKLLLTLINITSTFYSLLIILYLKYENCEYNYNLF